MKETLDIYPKVKGLQVLNDMGQHMFKNYAGKWIPDTPGRRRVITGWGFRSCSPSVPFPRTPESASPP